MTFPALDNFHSPCKDLYALSGAEPMDNAKVRAGRNTIYLLCENLKRFISST